MPIKYIVATLALVSILGIYVEGPVKGASTAERAVTTSGVLTLRRGIYRVITTGDLNTTIVPSTTPTDRDKDVFRAVFSGVTVSDGDSVSMSFVGPDGTVDIGAPDCVTGTNPALTIARRKARGPIGAAPYAYQKAKVKVNTRSNRIVFLALRGRAQASPVLSSLNGTTRGTITTANITVTLHVLSGGTVTDVPVVGSFMVRHNVNRRKLIHIYRGKSRSN